MARVRLNRSEINRDLRSPGGSLHREIAGHTRRVTALAKQKANVDTGKMRAQVNGSTFPRGKVMVGRIESPAEYTKWVHQGRGPVEAKHAQALRFRPRQPRPARRGSRSTHDGYVYAVRVGPYEGNPFLTDGLKEGQPWPVTEK